MRQPTETVKWFIRSDLPGMGIVDYAQRSDGTWFTRYHYWKGSTLTPYAWQPMNSALDWIQGAHVDATVRLPAKTWAFMPRMQRWIPQRIPSDPTSNYYATP